MSDNNKSGPNAISPSFCAHAWEQTHVTPMGIVKPCCIFDGPIKNSNNKPYRISDAPIEEIWNSPHYREIRRKMLNGEVVPECAK